MATWGRPAAVIHNGAHLFVISSRRGDSRKQRTGYGGAEQKAIRSTAVQPPRPRCSRGLPPMSKGGSGRAGAPLLLLVRTLARGGKDGTCGGRRGRAKCRELPVGKRAFRRHFYFVSAENSRLTRARALISGDAPILERERKRKRDRRFRFPVVSASARSVPKSELLLFRNVSRVSRIETQRSHGGRGQR